MQWTVVIALIFALVVGIFAVQNVNTVTLKFFAYEIPTNLVVVVLGGVAFGALMIGILGLIGQIKARLQIRTLRGKIKSLEKELNKTKAEYDLLASEKSGMAIDLARYEGAQEEILAQEALMATDDEAEEGLLKNEEQEDI